MTKGALHQNHSHLKWAEKICFKIMHIIINNIIIRYIAKAHTDK